MEIELEDIVTMGLKMYKVIAIDGYNDVYTLREEKEDGTVVDTRIDGMLLRNQFYFYKQNPYTPVTIPIVDGKASFAELGKQHTCTWKTYTGLNYKEEYCESCNATKNRRGIYE